MAKNHFSEGGFGKAFRATSTTVGHSAPWVIKRYKQETLETITSDLGQTVEEHIKKVIQMHSLARTSCSDIYKLIYVDFCFIFNRFRFSFILLRYFPESGLSYTMLRQSKVLRWV